MKEKIVRSQNPDVLENPFSNLDGFITPNEQFFVRNHFPEPHLDISTWRLKVEGSVSKPLNLSYDEILKMPVKTIAATLECAGNNRQFLVPAVKGVCWGLGGVSNCEWTGVPLSTILELAGVNSDTVDIMLEGADSGEVEEEPKPKGPIHFARSIPVAKASDVLLAYQMNGEPLTISHGFPLRALVPGWYAVASIKWLARVIASDRPFESYYQTTDYGYWEQKNGMPNRIPITTMQPKAEIARPQIDETIPRDADYLVGGAAWSGESEIEKVEISTDGGNTWNNAKLLGKPVLNAWRLWEFPWRTPSTPGPLTLLARATDAKQVTQPLAHDPDRGSYLITFCLPLKVEIK